MKSRSYVINALLFSACASIANSQIGPAKFNPQTASAFPVVTGHPYIANESVVSKTNLPDGQSATTTKQYAIYRDSSGRTTTVPARVATGYNPALTEIADPVAGYVYILDARTKTAYRATLPPVPSRTRIPNQAAPQSQSLGSMYVLGVEAVGDRVFSSGGTVDSWFSKELQLVMSLSTSGPQGSGSHTITSLKLEEPPASLFDIPTAYSVVSQVGPFTIN